jgi:Domain of unknown function (DUF4331)
MRRIRPTRRLGVVAAGLAAAAIAVPAVFGSSHREAPNIMLDPAADNTDVYAFTAPDAEDALTVISNWIPGQVPASGPNFFRWDDRARYYIKVDNNGDGKPDVDYRFTFDTEINNENSFLYAGPGAMGYGDLNLIQRYDVLRTDYGPKGRVTDRELVGNNLLVAPSNVGPKTFPSYGNFVDGANTTLEDGSKVFVGQREDPFFVDLGATFDAINVREGTGNEGEGKDDFSGMSTHSIALQIPEEEITRNGDAVAGPDSFNSVVGVWSTTERRRLELTAADYDKNAGRKISRARNGWVQVSRLGNPLVNEVIIPLGDKDKFNRTTPDKDAANYGSYVLEPELAAILNALFDVGAPETDREDLLVLLTGIEGVNQHKGKFAGTPVDTLKVNLGIDPTATPSRFGVIGGDIAGFPNGRRLADDVVDISLQVVAGFLVGNEVPLGDGVDVNDKPFLEEFPYVGDPDSGFDSDPSNRIEPGHPPVPPGG